jgi:hypothetical protein
MPQRPDVYWLFQQAQKLSQSDLEYLVAQLSAEVKARQSDDSEDDLAGWREEYRRCGKSTCRCANTDYRHGPYWYRSVWVDGRVKKEYRRSNKQKHQ